MAAQKNSISLLVATAVSLGAIIGAGIFVLSGTAIAIAGFDSLIAFLLVGGVALAVAFQSGELGSIMPNVKGSSYSYAFTAFGSEMGFVTGIMLFFSNATAISVIALGFGSYLASFLGITVAIFSIPFAIMIIIILSFVNLLGISKAAKTDFALVTVKIGILLLFAAAAIYIALSRGVGQAISNATTPIGGVGAIFAASVVIFFAYSGFQTVSSFTNRVKGGSVSAAKAIIYSVLISIGLYVLVTFALMLLLPPSSYKISADPLSYALKTVHAPSWLFIVVSIGALIATASATLAMILKSSRQVYQMGVDHILPKFTRKFDKSKDVAVNGILLSSGVGIIMLFAGNIYTIVSISNVGLFISYLMVCFAVIHFRRIGKKPAFKSPLYPILPIVSIIALLAFFIGLPSEALVFGLVVMLLLLVAYYFAREVKGKKPVRIKLFG